MKKTTIIAVAVVALVVLVGLGWYIFSKTSGETVVTPPGTTGTTTPPVTDAPPTSTPATTPPEDKSRTDIGKSVEGRDIVAYHFGTGDTELLFVGGIHGGYSWNTTLVAYELMDYLKANPGVIPAKARVTVIPTLNPDGLNKVVGTPGRFSADDVTASQAVQVSGRFNANTVDLNRNFDCDWQPTGKWQARTVSAGTSAFSEPESLAIKNYVEAKKPAAVVAWYAAAGGVFSSNCHDGVLAETKTLTSLYANASGYPAYESFDFYATTGDMTNWLAKIKIPAISVLLTNHTDTDWSKNQAGIDALLKRYAE